MSDRNRQHLKQEFSDGERPSGADFADLMDSFLNKLDDGLAVDGTGNLVLGQGLRLGGSSATTAGTLRFSGGRVQFHDGTGFVDLASGAGGVFQPVGGAGAVSYGGGNVGVGNFTAASPPTFRLEVNLGDNNGEAQRVRFGNAIVSNGPSAGNTDALFYQRSQDPSTQYALRQRSSGEISLNAPSGQRIRITQNDDANPKLAITTNGNVVVGSANNLSGAPAGATLQVNGEAFKNVGSGSWIIPSDARLKEDVRDLETGLAQLLAVRPVRFRYNGKGGTAAGSEGVGIIGQEIEQVFPEMVRRVPAPLDDGSDVADLRVYDGSALTYVLVNAVKELAARIEGLERTASRRRTDGDDD